jgi:hypothetical protein
MREAVDTLTAAAHEWCERPLPESERQRSRTVFDLLRRKR